MTVDPNSLSREGKSPRVSVRIPGSLLDDLDGIVDEGDYLNRSDAIRQALREFVRDGDRR